MDQEFIGEYPAYAEERRTASRCAHGEQEFVCMSCAEGATRSRVRARQGEALPECPGCGATDWWRAQ